MKDLSRVLRPRSIAVLGAGWAANVIEQCAKMGFSGPVWPVHPTRASIGGVACVAKLADLPEPPDAVFIGVNRHATVNVVRELSAMGAGGAVCFASGWQETGEAELQAQLVEAAGEMPILETESGIFCFKQIFNTKGIKHDGSRKSGLGGIL